MTKKKPDIQETDTDSNWRLHFDQFQDKFYHYRQQFFELGTIKKLKTMLDELPELSPIQERMKGFILSDDRNGLFNLIVKIATDLEFNFSYYNLNYDHETLAKHNNNPNNSAENIPIIPSISTTNSQFLVAGIEFSREDRNFYTALAENHATFMWLLMAANSKQPFYGSNHNVDSCFELPGDFTLHFDQPFEDFLDQLDRHRAHAWEIYKNKKIKKFVFLTDFLRDSEGRKLSIDKLAEKWDRCLKVYELSLLEKYRKKDGTPNYTRIGTDAGLYGYAHQHHVVNRTKDYLKEAERLIQSALDMTFPD